MNSARLLALALCSVAFLYGSVAEAGPNAYGKWALHYAGPHDPREHTCALTVSNCFSQIVVQAPLGPISFDIYVIAIDVTGIAGARFGIYGQGHFYFYDGGSRKCGDLEIDTPGWPGCGQGMAMTWASEQPGPNVTLGIIHAYAYGGGSLWTGPDPRVGFAEFCDGTMPSPDCDKIYGNPGFGMVGFGPNDLGCNPCEYVHGCWVPGFSLEAYGTCDTVPVNGNSWGAIKALYR